MYRGFRTGVMLLATLAIGGVGLAGPATAAPPSTSKSQIDYVVIAHPDDENEGWGAARYRSNVNNSYLVLIVATAGENSNVCVTPQNDVSGENPPPHGVNGKGSLECILSRRESALRNVGGIGAFDTSFNTRTGLIDRGTHDGAAIFSGSKTAIFFHNFGDGNLTTSEVNTAISRTRAQRGHTIPSIPEGLIIAGAFNNQPTTGGSPTYPDCPTYSHPDHRSVQSAIFNTTYGLTRWGTTCKTDPDQSLQRTMTSSYWRSMMEPASNGTYHKHYGWMLPGSWPYVDYQSQAPGTGNIFTFAREQYFWVRN